MKEKKEEIMRNGENMIHKVVKNTISAALATSLSASPIIAFAASSDPAEDYTKTDEPQETSALNEESSLAAITFQSTPQDYRLQYEEAENAFKEASNDLQNAVDDKSTAEQAYNEAAENENAQRIEKEMTQSAASSAEQKASEKDLAKQETEAAHEKAKAELEAIADAHPEVAAAKDVLDESVAELDAAKTNQENAANELESAELDLDKAQKEKAEADENYANAKQAAEETTAKLESAKVELERAQNALDASGLDKEKQAVLENAVKEAQRIFDEAQVSAVYAEESLLACKQAVESAQNSLADAQEAVEGAKQNCESAKCDLEQKIAAKDSAGTSLAEALSKVRSAEASMGVWEELVADYNSQLEGKDAELIQATDAREAAQKALTEAQNALDEVEQSTNDSVKPNGVDYFSDTGNARTKALLDKQNPAFNSQAWTQALDMLDPASKTNASNINNMLRALNTIRTLNEIRASLGLNELLVDNYEMLRSTINTNWSASNYAHVNNGAENLAWGYSDPLKGWYYEEKALFDKAVASGKYPGLENMSAYQVSVRYSDLYPTIGHYLNCIEPGYKVAGAGCVMMGGFSNYYAFGQTYSKNVSDNAMTVDQFETQLRAWADAKTSSASESLKRAQAAMDEARAAVQQAENNYLSALSERNEVKNMFDAVRVKLADAETAYRSASEEYERVKAAIDSSDEEIAKAQAALEQANEVLSTAQNDVDAAFLKLQDAQASADAADLEINEANAVVERASDELKTASDAYDQAMSEYAEVIETLDKASAKCAQAQDEAQNAQKNLGAAEVIKAQKDLKEQKASQNADMLQLVFAEMKDALDQALLNNSDANARYLEAKEQSGYASAEKSMMEAADELQAATLAYEKALDELSIKRSLYEDADAKWSNSYALLINAYESLENARNAYESALDRYDTAAQNLLVAKALWDANKPIGNGGNSGNATRSESWNHDGMSAAPYGNGSRGFNGHAQFDRGVAVAQSFGEASQDPASTDAVAQSASEKAPMPQTIANDTTPMAEAVAENQGDTQAFPVVPIAGGTAALAAAAVAVVAATKRRNIQ